MSSDEADGSDHSGTIYLIKQHPCLSADLTAMFRIVDDAYRLLIRRPSGSPGRHRIPSNLVMELESPPIGLPINCYRTEWLDSLPQEDRDALEATEPIDLQAAASLLR